MTAADQWLEARRKEGNLIEVCLLGCKLTVEACKLRQIHKPHLSSTDVDSINKHDVTSRFFFTCAKCPRYEGGTSHSSERRFRQSAVIGHRPEAESFSIENQARRKDYLQTSHKAIGKADLK